MFHLIATVIALAIFSSISGQVLEQQTTPDDVRFTTTKNGHQLHDNFYKLIEAQVPVQNAINEALSWDVEAQYEHFELLHEHIQAGDKYAEYCNELVKGAQDLLDVTLKKIGIDLSIDIQDYIKGLYDFEARRPISSEMQIVISGINEYRKKLEKEEAERQNEGAAGGQPELKKINQPSVEVQSESQDGNQSSVEVLPESQEGNQPSVQNKKQDDAEPIEKHSDIESQTSKTASMGI